ncbi:hypothetical protein [uncultured Alistipes sp.]|uniref:hypothetical protein n=1 Tax=uncultured Alistipes sp. TaxID=538949 RepID=UPI00320B16FD
MDIREKLERLKARIMRNDFLRTITKCECHGFTILSLLLFVSLDVSGQAILLDKTTGQRISYAQILNNTGAVVGTTDIDGNLPQDVDDEVVTIQHIAYSPKSVKSSLFKEDTPIYLNPIEYQLNAVTVTAENREYIHLKTYFRSYQLNDSCMKYFRDGYLDFFIDTKHKDVERLAIKIRNFQNDSLIDMDKERANTLVDKYIYTPSLDGLTLMETLKKEGWKFTTDSIDSRLRLNKMVGGAIRIDTIQRVLRVEYNVLSTKKKTPKTLFGYTTRFENYYQTENYIYNPGYQSYMDLINRKNYRKLFFSHKKDTKEQMIEIFDELYVLEHEYITKDEIKQYKKTLKLKSNNTQVEWNMDSTIVTPLAPQLEQILINNLSQVE